MSEIADERIIDLRVRERESSTDVLGERQFCDGELMLDRARACFFDISACCVDSLRNTRLEVHVAEQRPRPLVIAPHC